MELFVASGTDDGENLNDDHVGMAKYLYVYNFSGSKFAILLLWRDLQYNPCPGEVSEWFMVPLSKSVSRCPSQFPQIRFRAASSVTLTQFISAGASQHQVILTSSLAKMLAKDRNG